MADGTMTFMAKRTVVSTRATAPGNFCHLSVLDRLMEPNNHVKIVYYYPSSNVEPGEWTKKLRESLASVISDFPVINGRLLKNQAGHWMVKCNDGGLRMMEVKVNGSVEDWLKTVDREKELKLVFWEEMFHKPYFWSTFYVQVTEFEKGGVAIGISCSHLLADPICATMFFKAWADITLSGRMSTPPFFHPLPQRKANHFDDKNNPNSHDLINYYKSSIGRPPTSLIANQKYATITFSFTDAMVRDCIAMAESTTSAASSAKSFSPSFAALAALFWVSLSKVKGRLLEMSVCLDMRNVLGLDQGFFGNCMIYKKVRLESEANVENMLPEATKAIGEVAKKMNAEAIKDLIQWLQCNDHNQTIPSLNGYDDDLICANLEGVNPYLATFKDMVEPLRVSYYVEPTAGPGRVQVFRSALAPGEGPMSRVVMATVPEDEIGMLCKDDVIQRFSPIVLMGTNKT